MVLNEICGISDKSLQQDPIVDTLDAIFQHYIILKKIDMLHGSTVLSIYFFNSRQNLTNIMVINACSRLTTFSRKRRILIVTSSCSF